MTFWINERFLQIVLLFALFAVISAAPAPKADPNYGVYSPYGYGVYSPSAYSYSNVVSYPSAYAYPTAYGGEFVPNFQEIWQLSTSISQLIHTHLVTTFKLNPFWVDVKKLLLETFVDWTKNETSFVNKVKNSWNQIKLNFTTK